MVSFPQVSQPEPCAHREESLTTNSELFRVEPNAFIESQNAPLYCITLREIYIARKKALLNVKKYCLY